MARIIDLPEIGEPDQPQEPKKFDMPKHRDRASTGCAVIIAAWLIVMVIFAVVAVTGGMAKLAFWAVS